MKNRIGVTFWPGYWWIGVQVTKDTHKDLFMDRFEYTNRRRNTYTIFVCLIPTIVIRIQLSRVKYL